MNDARWSYCCAKTAMKRHTGAIISTAHPQALRSPLPLSSTALPPALISTAQLPAAIISVLCGYYVVRVRGYSQVHHHDVIV